MGSYDHLLVLFFTDTALSVGIGNVRRIPARNGEFGI